MSGNAQEWAGKITWDAGADPISEAEYAAIKAKIFPEAWPGADVDFYYTLKARHFIYSHTGPGEPWFHNGMMTQQSDCGGGGTNLGGTGTELKTFENITKGTKFAGLGVSALAPLSTAAVAVGWATLGIGLVLAPLAFIAAHHAKAVALEQHDICGATVAGNAMLDDIDAQFYADAITEAQAVQGLTNLRNGLAQAMGHVIHDTGRTKGTCNAACAYMLYFDGLVELRKSYLYPAHTAGIASKILPPIASQAISTAGASISTVVSGLTGGSVKLSNNAGFLLLILLIGIVAMAASKKGVVRV